MARDRMCLVEGGAEEEGEGGGARAPTPPPDEDPQVPRGLHLQHQPPPTPAHLQLLPFRIPTYHN